MIDFKTFLLIEQIINESVPDDSGWEHDERNNMSVHRQVINGHYVEIKAQRLPLKNGSKVHTISYQVDGSSSRDEYLKQTHGVSIARHVANRIHGYVAHKINKGDTLTMAAFDKNNTMQHHKDSKYSKFADKLAAKFGGKHTELNYRALSGITSHRVTFN